MRRRALWAAFPHTVPILAGFIFLGLSYGFLMSRNGFAVWVPVLMSAAVFAGSMQFVAVPLLLGGFAPLDALLMTLMVNARHLFYGLSLLKTYEGLGWKRWYLIFGLCDETFSLHCAVEAPEGVDRGWFLLWISLLDQLYWVAGTALGALIGSRVSFATKGIDFALTALFVTILLGQWERAENRLPALTGITASLASLLIFGPEQFLLPAMALIVLAFVALRARLSQGEGVS